MNSHKPHILLTRPEHQSQNLAQLCLDRGLSVSHLPCIEIQAITTAEIKENDILAFDIVLFTSLNAVTHAHALYPLPWRKVSVHAIGRATANVLKSLGQAIAFEPQPPFSSESYLQSVTRLDKKKLLIVKGEGGRTLISEQLRQRDWSVSELDLYQRLVPRHTDNKLKTIFVDTPPDLISVGSNETYGNLLSIASQYKRRILSTPLVVNSDRCCQLAREKQANARCLVANPAGDAGQILQIEYWMNEIWNPRIV